MVDYASLAATAERLIAANGRDVVLARRSSTPADPTKPWRGTLADQTTLTVKAAIVPFESADQDGELIRRDDKQAFVAAAVTDPEEIESFDTVEDNGDELKIVRAEVIEPGDTRVLYTLQLRR